MKIKITVDVDEAILAIMDEIATSRDRSRSYIFREAAREYAERNKKGPANIAESVPVTGNDPKE